MFIKRSLCSSTFLFALFALMAIYSCSAMADTTAKTNSYYTRGVYVDVNAGYASINWKDFNPTRNFNFTSNGSGGFTIGADTGYEYNRYLAFELGWYYLPQAKYNTLNNINFKVQSWFAYFGLKLSVPVSQRFYFFGKLALAYRYLKFRSSPGGFAPDGAHNLWRPLGALGWRCYFGPNWSIIMQYIYMPGRKSNSAGAVVSPSVNMITLGYSYRFEV